MEKLTNNIAGKIAEELKLDNDNKEIIAYGMFALVHMALSIILVVIFGFIFHITVEALIVCFTGSTLRKYSGGAHASSPGRCAVIGTIICIGLAAIFSFLMGSRVTLGCILLLGLAIFILSYYAIYKLAPVDSAAKPIRKPEKKIRMKKGSIFVLSVYIIITLMNMIMYLFYGEKRFLIYTLCVYGGICWQVFTLTRAGHFTMKKMDNFLNQILRF